MVTEYRKMLHERGKRELRFTEKLFSVRPESLKTLRTNSETSRRTSVTLPSIPPGIILVIYIEQMLDILLRTCSISSFVCKVGFPSRSIKS